jgi:hypothetical protein
VNRSDIEEIYESVKYIKSNVSMMVTFVENPNADDTDHNTKFYLNKYVKSIHTHMKEYLNINTNCQDSWNFQSSFLFAVGIFTFNLENFT